MSTHSTTYGNLRKERKFARQLFLGISAAVLVAMVLVYVVSQMKAFYQTKSIEETQQTRPMEPTQ